MFFSKEIIGHLPTSIVSDLEKSEEPTCILNKEGLILVVNNSFVNCYGYPTEELFQKHFHDLLAKEYKEQENLFREKFGTSLITVLNVTNCEMYAIRKTGESFPIQLIVSPFESTKGEKLFKLQAGEIDLSSLASNIDNCASAISKDIEDNIDEQSNDLRHKIHDLAYNNLLLAREIREKEKLAIELASRKEKLEKSLTRERELGLLRTKLVSMASHEFKTPLTTMLSSVELLDMASPEKTPLVKKHLLRLRETIGYLNNILENFLRISKMDDIGLDLIPEELYLPEVFDKILEGLELMAKPGQEINYTKDKTIGNTKHSYKGLRLIINNLMTNAFKYSDQGSLIEFEIKKVNDRIIILVKDEGIGIPEGEYNYLFERFYRASNSENIKGTGLGLNIVNKYCESMNGYIMFTKNLPKGTVFAVNLPYTLEF